MSFSALAPYLQVEYPKAYATASTAGNRYLYRGLNTVLSSNLPLPGTPWADGNPVSSTEIFNYNDRSSASAIGVLTVTTAAVASYSSTIGTPAAEDVQYHLRWRPVVKPIEVHPDFTAGGTYELVDTDRKDIIFWRGELNADLKRQYKYNALDSAGSPTGSTVTITSTNALKFIKLLQIGVEEYTDYLPIWKKRSYYIGSTAPAASTLGIGAKVTPSGSYPTIDGSTNYEWVKSADDVERIGRELRWRRDEEWEGANKVYASAVHVYPPA